MVYNYNKVQIAIISDPIGVISPYMGEVRCVDTEKWYDKGFTTVADNLEELSYLLGDAITSILCDEGV